MLLAVMCRPVSASTVVSNYSSFLKAINGKEQVITNFVTNSTISLTTVGETIQIKYNVIIDGGTNDVAFDGNGVTRIFTVATNCLLALNNLQVLNGSSTNGGAIYNSGTLVISNCTISGNSATNVTGSAGATNSSGGNGGGGGSGGSAYGGAIYSHGSVSIYNSVLGTNSALGGSGGSGGNGGNSLIFAGDGGNGGNGGSAGGAAIYITGGTTNIFVSTEFFNNTCTAGTGGGGGAMGTGAWPTYNGGTGGTGGAAAGGAVYVAGRVFVTNCVFANNTLSAGAAGSDLSGEKNGANGGSAQGGGLFISGTVSNAYVENTVIFNNSCTAGAGGSASQGDEDGGNGGSAQGGGLFSQALLMTVRNCTLATNSLAAGTNGSGTSKNGSNGSTQGWDIYQKSGVVSLSSSILSGGTNSANTKPNAYGVTDAGFNISTDSSLTRVSTDTLINDAGTNVDLDSGLANYGGPDVGPEDVSNPLFMTLAIVDGSLATNVYGVPGLSFPATDQLGSFRGSPASAGAFELNAINIDTNPPEIDITTQPTDQISAKGGKVTFAVDTAPFQDASTNALGFQWQLNGTNLSDNATFSGATSNTLTVKNVQAAISGETNLYRVVVSPSLLETSVTSSVVRITMVIPLHITTQPASKTKVPNGSVVTFNVAATGSPPFSYQWYWVPSKGVTNMLADANEISGSSTNVLTINPATANDNGSYFVVVTDLFHATNSASAVLGVVPDTAKPTVAFSSPAAGTRTNHLVITGTASDDAQVTNVIYWVTNVNAGNIPVATIYSNTASLGANGTTTKTWTITNAPFLPGTNYVTVQSVSFSGSNSALTTLTARQFFYKVPSQFHLTTNGPGTFTGSASVSGDVPPTNLAMLNIGEGYTLTAVPAKNNILSNWVSSSGFVSNTPVLRFIMESNLAIAAHFTTNLFNGAAGIYNGLFYDTNEVTEQTAGMLYNLTLKSSGTYSATLLLAGSSYSISGAFDTSGHAGTNVSRTAAKGGPVNIQMNLNWTSGEITGSVSNAPLEAWKSAPSSPSDEYTVVLDPGTNASPIPPGSGYILITNQNGSVALTGALADGTAFNQKVPLGMSNDVPVYVSLYNNSGLILGWLGLSNGVLEAETPMAWVKPAATSGLYVKGFTNYLLATGSLWTNPPAKTSAFNGVIAIINTNLNLNFVASITNNTLVKAANNVTTNSLTGTFYPKTGLLQIIFGNGTGKAATTGYAALLQDSTNQTGGFYATKTNAGAILLTP